MTGTRERHRVIIYGKRPDPASNEEYYTTILTLAKELSEERGEPMTLYPNMQGSDNYLGEVVVPSREFADELKRKLGQKDLYERVEIDSQKVKKIFEDSP